ncbi:MAG TPA: SHOCT domain-containing protein [Jiangellales bacterium]|nr:SHOCT domain-containing protein [Jiangellales bacterium]
MPGLIRGVARTAVVAGTASAVSGRVQRRQQGRWAQQDAQAYAAEQYQAQQAYAPPPAPAAPEDDTIARLKELAALRDQGVLTDEEFAAQKARILGG